jgi:hypothetical protein
MSGSVPDAKANHLGKNNTYLASSDRVVRA